jgi:YCII-related domain
MRDGGSKKGTTTCPKRRGSRVIAGRRIGPTRPFERRHHAQILVIQRSQPGEKREKPSPGQMQEMYAVFNAWKDKFRQNIVDMGGRLGGGKVVTSEGATDGPFVEAKEVVGGFMIISAASLEEAMQVARECPGVVMPGSSVEVREIHTP